MGVIENEVFLSIEDSIAKRVTQLLHATLDEKIIEAGVLIGAGDFNAARDIINKFDVTHEMFTLDGFIRTKFIQSALFGASQIVDPEISVLIIQPHLVDPLNTTVQQFRTLITNSIRVLQDTANKFIRALEEDAADVAVNDGVIKSFGGHVHGVSNRIGIRKDAASETAALFNNAMTGNMTMLSSIGSSLTTSRVITYGFLLEASANGILTYMVSEVLDARTCPVCQFMHGQTFSVEIALARMTRLIQITDPAELRAAAPFADQSAAGMAELRELDGGDLQARGMNTPPYHPLCRGIVVETGRDVGAVQQDILPVRPGLLIPSLVIPTLIQPKPDGATGPVEPDPNIDPSISDDTTLPIFVIPEDEEEEKQVSEADFQMEATALAFDTLSGEELTDVLTLIITDPKEAADLLGLTII